MRWPERNQFLARLITGASFEDGLNTPMALHFAPTQYPAKSSTLVHGQSASASRFAQAMAGRAMQRVANDNGLQAGPTSVAPTAEDPILRAALRHFAQHGLGAAKEARIEAEKAFFNDDRRGYDWWLGITRALDKRLAKETESIDAERLLP